MSSGKPIWVIECKPKYGDGDWILAGSVYYSSHDTALTNVDYFNGHSSKYQYRAWPYVPKEQK